ncbi:hypothetical protein M8J76_004969 [Diaphorina citri]|nr:hypothetical protein M8J75_009101 [Diaphorina citri]KAI5719095.1 hypothetical protein M8J76_004969 [Diaphorina citri]
MQPHKPKQFTPYKRIIVNTQVSCREMEQSTSRKRPSNSNSDEATTPKNKKINKSLPGTKNVNESVLVSVEACHSGNRKRSRSKKKKKNIGGTSDENGTSPQNKHNKENKKDDIIVVEDSNDGMVAPSIETNDCVIVLDGNANIKHTNTQTVTCNLDSLKPDHLKNLASPRKMLNSNPLSNTLGSVSNNFDRLSQVWNEPIVQPIINSTVPKSCKVKKSKIKQKTPKSKKSKSCSVLNKLFAKANILDSDASNDPSVIDITEDHSTSSGKSMTQVSPKTGTQHQEQLDVNNKYSSSNSKDNTNPKSNSSENNLNSVKNQKSTTENSETIISTNTSDSAVHNEVVTLGTQLLETKNSYNTSEEISCKNTSPLEKVNGISNEIISLSNDPNTTITLDDSRVALESSDVCIIEPNKNLRSNIKSVTNDSIIIDLEMLTPDKNVGWRQSGDLPLIVYDKVNNNEQNQLKYFTSLDTWPDMVPSGSLSTKTKTCLRGKKCKKKKAQEPKLVLKKARKCLSQIEAEKLSAIRRIVPNNTASESSSGAVWSNFNLSNKPFAQTSNTRCNNLSNNPYPQPSAGPSSRPDFIPLNGFPPRNSTFSAPGIHSLSQARPQLEDNNMYNAGDSTTKKKTGLRPIIIDGSNVAIAYCKFTHPNNFTARGIEIVVDYFKKRGHKEIFVFLPSFRGGHSPEILNKLQSEGILHYTPSRRVDGKLQCAYDDRYIVQVATEYDGVIVSNDRYRDIMQENDKWKATIERRLLMFNFVKELLIFPQDPLGRDGPSLDEFLRF